MLPTTAAAVGPGPTPSWPRIQGGVDLATGRFERVYDRVSDNLLSAPNDLVFDRQRGFWFIDLGHASARARHQSGCCAKLDGLHAQEVSFFATGYNGVGLSPDEQTVYASETFTDRFEVSTCTRRPRPRGPSAARSSN